MSLQEILGITMVVCLMYDEENPFSVMDEYERLGIKCMRIPMRGASEVVLKSEETIELVCSLV